MRIVVDCNVIIAAGIKNGTCRKVLMSVLKDHTLIISEPIVTEYVGVIQREKFVFYRSYLQELVLSLCQLGELVEATESIFYLLDKDDEKYLATAQVGKASLLITGNKKHFPQDYYGSIEVVTPTQYEQSYLIPVNEGKLAEHST